MSLVWFMWTLLLYLSIDCYWAIHAWTWPSGWLTVGTGPNRSVWAIVQVLTTWIYIFLNIVWYMLRSLFGYATCDAKEILFWCCLKVFTGCVYSGASWEELCLWLALYNMFGAIKQSTVFGCLCFSWMCMGKKKMCTGKNKMCTKASSYQHLVQEKFSKKLKEPWDLPLLACCLTAAC